MERDFETIFKSAHNRYARFVNVHANPNVKAMLAISLMRMCP